MGGPSLAELDQIAGPVLSAAKSLNLGVGRYLSLPGLDSQQYDVKISLFSLQHS